MSPFEQKVLDDALETDSAGVWVEVTCGTVSIHNHTLHVDTIFLDDRDSEAFLQIVSRLEKELGIDTDESQLNRVDVLQAIGKDWLIYPF